MKCVCRSIIIGLVCVRGFLASTVRAEPVGDTVRIEYAHVTNEVVRPCVLIPELAKAPAVDGVPDDEAWQGAGDANGVFLLGSKADTAPFDKLLIGHRDGVLYALMEFGWEKAPPDCKFHARDGDVWNDESVELFLAPTWDLPHPRQLGFNIAGVRADYLYTLGWGVKWAHERMDPDWNPDWTVVCKRKGNRLTAETSLPLDEILGMKGTAGEVLRLNIHRNGEGHYKHFLSWFPVAFPESEFPKLFAFGVLTGPNPDAFSIAELDKRSAQPAIFPAREVSARLPLGHSFSTVLHNPVAGQLAKEAALPYAVSLKTHRGDLLFTTSVAAQEWPLRLILHPGKLLPGAYTVEVTPKGGLPLAFRTSVSWESDIVIEAENEDLCEVSGKSRVSNYPRGTGARVLRLYEGAYVRTAARGRAISLQLPPVFPTPGPSYGALMVGKLRCKVDDGLWKEIALIEAPKEVLLASDLEPGEHTVVVEPVGGSCAIDAFRFRAEPPGSVQGVITTDWFSELLMDVRVDVFRDGELKLRRYVRNPISGRFAVVGLPPGGYQVHFEANGWTPYEVPEVLIERSGQTVDLGVIVLKREPGLSGQHWQVAPGPGSTINVAPAGTFTADLTLSKEPQGFHLVSPYKRVALGVVSVQLPAIAYSGLSIGRATLSVPAGTPDDMYALSVDYGRWSSVSAQAICVRESLPEEFAVACVGHMNTWGQQASEYLGRVAEMAQLAGARVFLAANEVNAAYIAGGLSELRIPYLVTAGNHTMARWEGIYGPDVAAYDDGPLRIVTVGDKKNSSWPEAHRLVAERIDARNRSLLCYEGFAPAAIMNDPEVDFMFSGHSSEFHPYFKQFPAAPLHPRLPDVRERCLYWVAMTHNGPVATRMGGVPVFNVPRDGLSPLRVEFSGPNDGTAAKLTVKVINDLDHRFPHGRLRFLLFPGDYRLEGASVLQEFNSDDGKVHVIDAGVDIAPKQVTTIHASR